MSDDGPLRLSWSRIRTHAECHAKGALLRDHKSPSADIRNFFHGNVVDLAMRRWLRQEPPTPGWMVAQIGQLMEQAEADAKATGDGLVKWRHSSDKAEVLEFCRDLVVRLEDILGWLCLPYEWEEAVRFSVPATIPGPGGEPRQILLVGEIDLLVRDLQSDIHVWDLKATKDNAYFRKVTGQLAFYEVAWAAKTGKWPVRSGLIQPMCDQPVIAFDFSQDNGAARTQIMQRIISTANDIWAGRLDPKADNQDCVYCPVRHACPKFKVEGGRGRAQLLLGAK